jgi:GT2 family glycosyltransferase
MNHRPQVSIVLATYNRRDVVLHTLEQLNGCGLQPGEYEVIVVDNASTDGTADALRGRPGVSVHALDDNLGSCAKAFGVDAARGSIVLFLDDDSFPRSGCLERMLARFAEDAELAAAGFTVHLPDGSQECSALPHVFVGCGVGLRRRALNEVGGLDGTFFMQAEEYDLSFRLMQAGWKVEVCGDLQVDHLKSPQARRSERTTFQDVRNNLRVIARYLPGPYAEIYRQDWLQRYRWFAERAGHITAFERGQAAGRWLGRNERHAFRPRRLTANVLERVFCWSRIEQRMRHLATQGARRIVLLDLGKNVHAFWRGARAAGLEVLAIADDAVAAAGRSYRSVAVVTAQEATALGPHAYVVSNTSYVHADRRWREWISRTSKPVHNWFEPPGNATDSGPWGAEMAESNAAAPVA